MGSIPPSKNFVLLMLATLALPCPLPPNCDSHQESVNANCNEQNFWRLSTENAGYNTSKTIGASEASGRVTMVAQERPLQ